MTWLDLTSQQDTYLVDSCPFPVCHNRRACRCRLYQDANKAYWGYCAAKEEYFYGLKAHGLTTASGRPVEVLLCGCRGDLTGFREMSLNLPAGSRVIGDKIYTDYDLEDQWQQDKQITLLPLGKPNRKRQHPVDLLGEIRCLRRRIETVFRQLVARLPHRLHAVRASGFESKIMALFVAFAICCVEKENQ